VSTGPAFDSQRQEASDFADTLAQLSPEVFSILGPLIVKLKNLGPIGDEIAELLEAMQPPAVHALKQAKKQNDPKVLAQQLAQATQRLQQLEQIASQMHQELQGDQAKYARRCTSKELQLSFQRWKTEADNETKITVAELGAKVDRLALFLEERQAARARSGRGHRRGARGRPERARSDARRQPADSGTSSRRQQADQGAAIASDQMQQQAALEPPPDAGGGE
jgi:hypothetical protein